MTGAHTPGSGDPEAVLADAARELLSTAPVAVRAWVLRVIRERCTAAGVDPAEVAPAAERAAEEAAGEVASRLRPLLAADPEAQPTTPLAILRAAVVHPTRVLADAGVTPPARDAEAARMFPGDLYGLTPGSWADVDPALAEPGLRWGAAKAMVILRRRRDR